MYLRFFPAGKQQLTIIYHKEGVFTYLFVSESLVLFICAFAYLFMSLCFI